MLLGNPTKINMFKQRFLRLAAASRRASTNCITINVKTGILTGTRTRVLRMYDDRWLPFAHWAAEKVTDLLCPTAAQIATVLFSLFPSWPFDSKATDAA